MHTIVFPLLLLPYILRSSKDVLMLLRYFDVSLSSDENEQNTLAVLLLKCEALCVLKKPITVEVLLPGYAPNLTWRKTPLNFDELYLQLMENQITLSTWSGFEAEMKRAVTVFFFVNAKGATFSDMLMIPKEADHAILIQEKTGRTCKEAGTQWFYGA